MTPSQLYQDFMGDAPTLSRDTQGSDDVEVQLARARGKARAEGFADGAESAEATFDRELQAQITSVSEALTHFAAERTAADAASIDAIRRILAGALTAYTPALSEAGLPALVADTVAQALASDLAGAVVVETSPDRIQDLSQALSGRDARLTFAGNPLLKAGEARVLWRGGFDHIDASNAIAKGAALLDERLRASGPQSPTRTDPAAPAPIANQTHSNTSADKDEQS